jgi:hypothetical protein
MKFCWFLDYRQSDYYNLFQASPTESKLKNSIGKINLVLVLLFLDSKKILVGKEKNSSNKVRKLNQNKRLLTTHSSREEKVMEDRNL